MLTAVINSREDQSKKTNLIISKGDQIRDTLRWGLFIEVEHLRLHLRNQNLKGPILYSPRPFLIFINDLCFFKDEV